MSSSSSSKAANDLIKECEEQLAAAAEPRRWNQLDTALGCKDEPQKLSGVKRPREVDVNQASGVHVYIPQREEESQIRFQTHMNQIRKTMFEQTGGIIRYMEQSIINLCDEYYTSNAREQYYKELAAENARLRAKLDSITKAMKE